MEQEVMVVSTFVLARARCRDCEMATAEINDFALNSWLIELAFRHAKATGHVVDIFTKREVA